MSPRFLSRFAAVAVGLAMVSSISLATPSNAEQPLSVDSFTVRPDTPHDTFVIHSAARKTSQSAMPTAALIEDLETVAEDSGRPLDELIAEQVGHDEFNKLTTDLEQNDPTFVSAGFGKPGEPASWIRFTEQPSDDLLAQLADLPLDVEVTTGDKAGAIELAAFSSSVLATFAKKEGVTSGYSVIDPITGAVTVAFDRSAALSDDELEALQASSLGAGLRRSTDSFLPAEVTFFEGNRQLAEETKAVKGGHSVTACTSGFTVRKGAQRGVVTAAHCANSLTYEGEWALHFEQESPGNVDGYDIGYGGTGAQISGPVDLQWHSTTAGNTTEPVFRSTSTSFERTVEDFANPAIGEHVCKWGKVTEHSCDDVTNAGVCYFSEADLQGLWCGLRMTAGSILEDGDSGGPWFTGNTASGISSGRLYDSGYHLRDLFTPESRISERLGVDIYVG